MSYVDGFVIPLRKKNLAAYRRLAAKAAHVWRDHGAVEYFECVGDDFENKCGIAFPKLAKVKSGETVLFSFIVYKSKPHRDRVNAKAMKDPRIAMMDPKKMPFDAKRMAYGGFRTIVQA